MHASIDTYWLTYPRILHDKWLHVFGKILPSACKYLGEARVAILMSRVQRRCGVQEVPESQPTADSVEFDN